MNGLFWLTIIISACTDFVIGAGGCLTTAMVATGSASMPTTPVMIFSIVTGAVTAARRVQALLVPPPEKKPDTEPTAPKGGGA